MVNLDQFEILRNPPNERWLELIEATNKDEGWMMGPEDYESWVRGIGQNNFSFYCAIDKASNKLAGTVILAIFPSVHRSPRLATVGMFYTRPEFRSTGIGSYLFKILMEGEENNNVGLNGVLAMTAKYSQRHGFSHYSPWKLSIYTARCTELNPANLSPVSPIKIVNRDTLNWNDYFNFDVKILGGVRRDQYIKNYLNQKGAHNRFAVHPDGTIQGVCNIREVVAKGLVLGPFYADSNEVAAALLKATVDSIPNIAEFGTMLLVAPNTNAESAELFNKLAEGKVEHCGYMMSQFTKEVVAVPDQMVYSLTDYANNFV